MMFRLKLLMCCIFLSALHFNGLAQGIVFEHGTWTEIVQKAKAQNKPIFVDVYTSWCGPCRVMAAQVFTLPEIGDKYNQRFINVKIDAEKGEGIALAKKYAVQSYPTYLFIDPQTEALVFRGKSSMPIADFSDLADDAQAKFIGQSGASLEQMKAKFDSQTDLNEGFLREYINRLKKEKKSYQIVLNYYLDHFVLQNFADDHQFFLASRFAQGNSKVFDYLVQNYKTVDQLLRKRDGLVAANVDRELNYELKKRLDINMSSSKLSKTERKEALENCYTGIRKINEPNKAEKMILTNQRLYYKKVKDTVNEMVVLKELINKYVLPAKYTRTLNKELIVIDKNNQSSEGTVDSVFAADAVRYYGDVLLQLAPTKENIALAMSVYQKSQSLTPRTAYYTNIMHLMQYNFGNQKKAIKAQELLVKKMAAEKDPFLNEGTALLQQMKAKEANLKFTTFRKSKVKTT